MSKGLYYISIAVVIAVLIIMILYNISFTREANEQFRIKARAFYHCQPPRDCKTTRPLTNPQLLAVNPFVWPYDGTFSQQEIITGLKPPGVLMSGNRDDVIDESQTTGIVGEPDHDMKTN